MFKKITQHNDKREGNALLIAILMTGILVLITVSLATLITAETRQIGKMIQNGKAQYLAEAGSETALYLIHQNRPGFEPTQNDEPLIININDTEKFSLNIDASTDQIPIVENYVEELVLDGGFLQKSELFDTLFLNESITIPLQPDTVNFEFQYYLPVEAEVPLADWDILLWKLFGQNQEGNTDSMTEYLPASKPITGSEVGITANNPAKFGTAPGGWTNGIFFEFSNGELNEFDINTNPDEAVDQNFQENYIEISRFLNEHTNNYLVVTNALNPRQINRGSLARGITLEEATRIKYRICTPTCQAVDENRISLQNLVPKFTVIESSGQFGQTTKELRTSVNREGFLPVFDFAIYRTANN
jgi:hypothetical protein